MDLALKIIVAEIAVYLLLCLLIWTIQRKLMYAPQKHVVTPHMHDAPEGMEQIAVQTDDGLTLKAFFLPPCDGRPVVIYFHGNTGVVADAAHKMIPLAKAGFGILMPEYRGYGGNPGSPSEEGLIRDALAARETAERLCPNAPIVYYGMSLGTGVANALAEKKPPAALIQEAGFTSFVDAAREIYWFLPLTLMMKDTYKTEERIRSLRAPLLVLHGERDKTVPVGQARRVFAAAGSDDKTIKTYPEGRHVNLFDFGSSNDALNWLSERFPQKDSRCSNTD